MENEPAILIVDDDEGTRHGLALVLKKKGYQVAGVGTGEAALALARDRPFNIALLDIRLPDMAGTELFASLKELEPDIQVLYITGYASVEGAIQALTQGAYHYFVKPVNMDEVVVRIEGALQKQRLIVENRLLYQGIQQELAERNRAEVELIRRNQELALLNQIITASLNNLGQEAVLETACRALAAAFELPHVVAMLLSEDKTIASIAAEYRAQDQPSALNLPLIIQATPAFQYLLTHHAPLVVEDARQDPRLEPILALLHDHAASLLMLPLVINEEVVGSLALSAPELRHFSAADTSLAWNVADQVAGALARARLSQTHKHMVTAIEQAAESVLITDTEGNILYVNPAFEQITGYSRAEAVGQSPRFLNGDKHDEAFHQEIWATISSGQVWRGRFINKKKDGSFYIEDVTISPVRDESGVIVNYVTVSHDVTRQLELEKQYQRVIASISDHIYMTEVTADGRYVNLYLSPVEKLTGYPQEKFKDWSFWPSTVIHPEDRPAAAAHAARLGAGRGGEMEYRLVRADGRVIWVRDSARVEVDGDSKIIYGVVSDITDRKQAEAALAVERASLARRVEERTAELSAANAELAQAARLKDEFLANMSHELRTPLNTILGMAEVLGLNVYGSLNEEQRTALGYIEESGRHLLALINDILDLSKIEADKLDMQIEPVSVSSVCQASLLFIKQMAHKKEIKITSALDERAQRVQADERRLKQILVNLLTNAVKFTPAGGQVGLEVTVDSPRSVIQFTVWDTGIGIARQDMERLFKPFVQLDSSLARQHEGTGLGLSLVYRLAELHGGSVHLESQVGQGSRFTVSLPWENPADREQQPGTGAVPAAGKLFSPSVSQPQSGAVSPEPLILLAEDNKTNIIVLQDYLGMSGYRVVVARNGAEAIERAQEERPALILMDIQMPGVDGLEAIRRLRADAGLCAIPIIALTALAMPGDRERCLQAGANEYLSKPIRLRELAAAIETQLQAVKTVYINDES